MLMLPSTLVKLLTAYCAGLLFQLALTGQAYSAEYYRWVDENGVLHITDNLHDVPPNQRPRAGRVVAPDSPRPAEPERKAAPTNKASVPMERHGAIAMVQATLNNRRSAKFVVDTGASYTLISNAVASDLGINLGANPKTLPFQTANGLINAPIANIESISIGGLEIRNIAIAIHDAVPDPQVAGLLGLNFLSNFKMDIDTQKGMLHLEKK
jgi:clan AA aspartic protease (TIGR02281 family)